MATAEATTFVVVLIAFRDGFTLAGLFKCGAWEGAETEADRKRVGSWYCSILAFHPELLRRCQYSSQLRCIQVPSAAVAKEHVPAVESIEYWMMDIRY